MSAATAIRIILADDHAMFREGMKQLLSRESDLRVVGEAGTTAAILEAATTIECDVIVLDIAMPGRGGLDVLKELKQMNPQLHVLILSMHPEDIYAYRAIKAGASGYLTKNKASEELIEAIRRIASGRKYISAEVAEQLAIDLEQDADKPLHARLGDREFQVLCMIASGKTVQQIANELAISSSSVSTMRARILKKFGMKTNAELTHYAIKQALVG
jgi:two-component system, NarL family, invasion response regulator UvrY